MGKEEKIVTNQTKCNGEKTVIRAKNLSEDSDVTGVMRCDKGWYILKKHDIGLASHGSDDEEGGFSLLLVHNSSLAKLEVKDDTDAKTCLDGDENHKEMSCDDCALNKMKMPCPIKMKKMLMKLLED